MLVPFVVFSSALLVSTLCMVMFHSPSLARTSLQHESSTPSYAIFTLLKDMDPRDAHYSKQFNAISSWFLLESKPPILVFVSSPSACTVLSDRFPGILCALDHHCLHPQFNRPQNQLHLEECIPTPDLPILGIPKL